MKNGCVAWNYNNPDHSRKDHLNHSRKDHLNDIKWEEVLFWCDIPTFDDIQDNKATSEENKSNDDITKCENCGCQMIRGEQLIISNGYGEWHSQQCFDEAQKRNFVSRNNEDNEISVLKKRAEDLEVDRNRWKNVVELWRAADFYGILVQSNPCADGGRYLAAARSAYQ